MDFRVYLQKLQSLPESKKKIVLWTIVVILGLIMGFFWINGTLDSLQKFGQSSQSILPQIEMPATEIPTTEAPTDQTANWQTYKDNYYGFEIEYPPDWGYAESVSQLSPSLAFCAPELKNDDIQIGCNLKRYDNGHLQYEGEKFVYLFGIGVEQNFGDDRYHYLGFNNSAHSPAYYYLYIDTTKFPEYKTMASQIISTFKFTE